MACSHGFTPGLQMECLREVIADVRSRSISVTTVTHSLWVAGCAAAMLEPKPIGPIGDLSADHVAEIGSMNIDQICDALEPYAFAAEGSELAQAKIDPATILTIIQLIWELVKNLKK